MYLHLDLSGILLAEVEKNISVKRELPGLNFQSVRAEVQNIAATIRKREALLRLLTPWHKCQAPSQKPWVCVVCFFMLI